MFVLFNLPEYNNELAQIFFFPKMCLEKWYIYICCWRKTLGTLFVIVIEDKNIKHLVTLCPEFLHPTTSRVTGIHFQGCIAVTKAFSTKSSWKLN